MGGSPSKRRAEAFIYIYIYVAIYMPTPSKNGLIFVLCVKTKLKYTTKPSIFDNR